MWNTLKGIWFSWTERKPWPDPERPLQETGYPCPKCGVVWKGVMLYSCGHADCPVQPRAMC